MTEIIAATKAQIEPMLTRVAVEVAELVRDDDGDAAGTSLGTTAMMVVALLLRDNKDAGNPPTTGFDEVNAMFRVALAAQRLSVARTAKASMAFDVAMITFNHFTLGMVVQP